MFGFGKKKKKPKHAAEKSRSTAPQQGGVPQDNAADNAAENPAGNASGQKGVAPLHMVTNITQYVISEVGLTTMRMGESLWIQAPSLGLEQLDTSNVDVRIEASVSDDGVLLHTIVVDWHGVLSGMNFISLQNQVNTWNARFIGPRLMAYPEADDRFRIRGDIVMTWFDGFTLDQFVAFVRDSLATISRLEEWLEENWPQAQMEYLEREIADNPMMTPGNDNGLDVAEEKLKAGGMLSPSFGFQLEETPEVTAQRIVDAAAKTGRAVELHDKGYISVDYDGLPVIITPRDGVLSWSIDADVRADDVETLRANLVVLSWKYMQGEMGIVSIVQEYTPGVLALNCVRHMFVSQGLGERELELTVPRMCDLLYANFMTAMREITG